MIVSDRSRASAIVVGFWGGIQGIALWIAHFDFYLHVLRILVFKNSVYYAGPCREIAHYRATNSIADPKVANRTCSLDVSRY